MRVPGTRRRWRRWIVVPLLLLVGVPVLTAIFTVYTPWGRERMRTLAIDTIRNELGLYATLRHVDVELFPPEVTATGIALDDPKYGRFAEADQLTIRPSFLAFMQGSVDLKEIELRGPTLNLIYADGQFLNLPKPKKHTGGSAGRGGRIPVGKLRVSGAKLTLDAGQYGKAALEGASIALDVTDGVLVDVNVRVVAGTWNHFRGTERVQRLEAKGRVTPEGIDLDQFTFWSPFVKLELRNGHLPIPFNDGYQGHVFARVNMGHLKNLPHDLELPQLDGIVEVDGEVTGTSTGPKSDGVVRVFGGKVDQWGLGDLELHARGDKEGIEIHKGFARIVKNGGDLKLTSKIGFGPDLPFEANLDLSNLEFAKLMDQLGISHDAIVQWNVSGPIQLKGNLNPLDLDGALNIKTSDFLVTMDPWHADQPRRIVGVTRADVSAKVAVDLSGITFKNIRASTPGSRIKGDLFLGFEDLLQLKATVDGFDLADASPLLDFPVSGKGRADVVIDGPYGTPKISGNMKFDDFSFDTHHVGNVESDWRLEEGVMVLRFPKIAASKNESKYTVDNLVLDFRRDAFRIGAKLLAHRLTLADFYHAFHFENDERFAGYQAEVSGVVDLDYTLGYPGDSATGTLRTDIDLDVMKASLDGFEFQGGEFKGSWEWLDFKRGLEGGRLAVDHAHLRKGKGTLTLSGSMDLGAKLKMTTAIDRFSIRRTEGLGTVFNDLGGVYSVMGDIRGTADVPRANLNINVTGLSYGGKMLGDGRFFAKLTDRDDPWIQEAASWNAARPPKSVTCPRGRLGFLQGQWPADPPLKTRDGPTPALKKPMAFVLCGTGLNGSIATDIAIGRTRTYPLRGVLTFDSFDAGPVLQEVSGDKNLFGVISGRASFDGGSLLRAGTLDGDLLVTRLELGQKSVRLSTVDDLVIDVNDGIFQISKAAFEGPSSKLNVTGNASLSRGLALQVDGKIDVGLLATVSPRFSNAEGNVRLRVNVGGRLDDPSVIGKADVRDTSFRYAGIPAPLTGMNGQVTFSARKVLFEGFRAQMSGGSVSLTGAATLKRFSLDRYEFALDAENLALKPESGVDLAAGGRVELFWNSEMRLPMLQGTLRLDRLVYSKPMQLFQTLSIGDLQRQGRADFDVYDPDEDRVELDVRIIENGQLRIATNVIDADVKIEDAEQPFRIVGTDRRPGVVGTLDITRGTVLFRNSRFQIRRGIIDFNNEDRIDPNFDLIAETEVRRSGGLTGPSWRINLHAHGTSDAFRLDTSSEPALSQEDIILLLTMGMTRAEAEQLQTGDLTGSAALEALATVSGINREVRRAVPVIDDFRISSQYSPRTNRTEPQVTVGKRITDDVRVSASTGISESQELRTAVEWRLSDRTSVQAAYDNINTSTTSTVGNIGVDVRWRLEFD